MSKNQFIFLFMFILGTLLLFQTCKESKETDLPIFKVEDFVPSYIKVDSLVKIRLKNNRIDDYLVFGIDKNNIGKNRFLGIYSYDSIDNNWKQKYSDLFDSYTLLQIDTGYIGRLDEKLLIIKTTQGSGGFLSYRILGYIDKTIRVFLTKDLIFQGSINFLGDQIIEKEGQKSIAYIFNGESFIGTSLVSTPYKPLDVDDIKLEYSIDNNDNIISSLENIRIRQGQKLYLVRNGGGSRERILYSGNIIEYNNDYYLAKNIGKGYLSIIPSGYNSEKSKTINIEVYK
ncbi:MAG: hypothetical protein ABR980_14130 [Ignavibacteriaceae bacterium]